MPQPANKRFVMEDKLGTELALKANIASPTFTGTVTAGAGGISVPVGDVVVATGDIDAPSGAITGSTVTANGVVTGLSGVTASAGDITAVGGDIVATAGDIVATAGDINATAGDINATLGTVTSENIVATSVNQANTATPAIIAGDTSLNWMKISYNVIQAENISGYSQLSLNNFGGDVAIGKFNGTDNINLFTPVIARKSITAEGTITTLTGDGNNAPLIIPAGTLMSGLPVAKVIEADTNAFYGTTNATHGRGVIATNLFTTGTATFVSSTGAQNLFPVPGDTLAMAANTTYMVEGLVHISVPATSSVAHTMSFTLNGGTAATTGQVMAFATQNNTSATAIPTAAASYLLTGTGASTIWATASTAATAVFRTVHFKGIVRCAAAGTFIPRITTSVASVAIPAGTANNYISLTPVGSNAVTAVGAWT